MMHRAGDFGGVEGRPKIYQVSQEAGKERAPLRKAVRNPHENTRGQTPTAMRTGGIEPKSWGKALAEVSLSWMFFQVIMALRVIMGHPS